MRNTNRLIALVLCCTLTLGAFAYRPPQAKAIAGVDDAVVIGALLSAFAGGCGLIFSNNGMSSNEIAQGLTAKWNDFKETLASVPATFSEWLGYDSMDALITDLRWDEVKNVLSVPRAIARKLSDFTDWLVSDVGITPGGAPQSVFDMPARISINGYTLTYIDFPFSIQDDYDRATSLPSSFSNLIWYPLNYMGTSQDNKYFPFGDTSCFFYLSSDLSGYGVDYSCAGSSSGVRVAWKDTPIGDYKPVHFAFGYSSIGFWAVITNGEMYRVHYANVIEKPNYLYTSTPLAPYWGSLPTEANDFSSGTSTGVQTPDLADDAETAPTPTITGVGWDAATIEELLQQILDQVQSNTLATTISVDATQTGGETGTDTDEDAKPYLPFIPQIFDKVKEIPGTLSNIWDTVKQLPAAIAEKISAFFTTLWGWLQDIIDEIKGLPAAVAEKVGALFTPDEALITEITDTFKGKFGFLSTLKQFANDLFGMTADSEPPVIWVHLENAESKFGYTYGDKQKILDFTWYQKYKANVDTLISGFLWLGFLWLLFKRVASIIQGGEMLTEYVHDFDQGRRDSNETKFQKWLWKD